MSACSAGEHPSLSFQYFYLFDYNRLICRKVRKTNAEKLSKPNQQTHLDFSWSPKTALNLFTHYLASSLTVGCQDTTIKARQVKSRIWHIINRDAKQKWKDWSTAGGWLLALASKLPHTQPNATRHDELTICRPHRLLLLAS